MYTVTRGVSAPGEGLLPLLKNRRQKGAKECTQMQSGKSWLDVTLPQQTNKETNVYCQHIYSPIKNPLIRAYPHYWASRNPVVPRRLYNTSESSDTHVNPKIAVDSGHWVNRITKVF